MGGAKIVARIFPNTFFTCIEVVRAAIIELRPDAVVMTGEYGGRAMITVERIAQNLNDGACYGLRDNDGKLLQDEPTAPGGPAACYATLPIRAMVRAMRDAGIPSDISGTAGTFCCNHLMYGILHYLAVEGLGLRAGWVHPPHLPEVAALKRKLGAPSMSAETAAAGLRAAIVAIGAHPHDIPDRIVSRLRI